MNVRYLRSEDLNEISHLVFSSTQELRGIDFTEESWKHFINSNTPKDFEHKLEDSEFLMMCCIERGKILGFISLKNFEKIDQLFVLPEARRKGVAKLLWETVKNEVIKKGVSGGFWVRSSTVAEPVYKKFGFEVEGDRQSFNGISFQLMRCKGN